MRPHDAPEPTWLARGQIPSLNGLRAISIALVLVAHLSHQGQFVPNNGIWHHLAVLGRLGVDMFFVISGFLITLLLIREHERYQAISLKQFYLRRAFRILPAYLVFLLGIGILCSIGSIQLETKDWIGVSTYTVSLVPKPSWDIGHIWSLSVEEHFYFLWPIVAFLLPRRAWILAIVTVMATPLMRWMVQTQLPELDASYCSLTRMDTVAVGCCLAYLARWAPFRRWASGLVRHGYVVSIALVLLVGISQRVASRYPLYDMVLHSFVIAGAFAVMVWIWTTREHSLLGRVLNSRPATAIGLLSYSIYLWQQPFLNPHSDAWYTQSPVNLVFVAAFALASYYLIEKPMLQLKDRVNLAPAPSKVSTVMT
jgi:peptidoglycan/LPS O-acetylase OafA/YrhL